MIKRIKSKKISFIWVFRHRWEEDKSLTNYTVWEMRNNYKLGFWFKISQAVGRIKRKSTKEETIKSTFNESNYVNMYQLGVNLLVCKTWIEFSFKPILTL